MHVMRPILSMCLLLVACGGGDVSQFPAVVYFDSVDACSRDLARPDLLPACIPSRNSRGDLCGCIGLPCCFDSSGCGAQMNCVTPSCWGPGGICVPYGSPGLADHPCANADGSPGGVLCENGKECVRGVCEVCAP